MNIIKWGGKCRPAGDLFSVTIYVRGAFRAPWGNASGGEVLSLTTYVRGAFRAPTTYSVSEKKSPPAMGKYIFYRRYVVSEKNTPKPTCFSQFTSCILTQFMIK